MQNQKQVTTKTAKIMSKNTEGKENSPGWALSIGFYPGILIGMRTYEEDNQTTHVFYLPFVDLAIEIYK